MDEQREQRKLERKALRKQMAPLGWALLIYLGIFNAAVYLTMIIHAVVLQVSGMSPEQQAYVEALQGNGIGYLIAVSIGLLLLRIWKGREFCYKTLWTQGKPMRGGDFVSLLVLLVGGQMAYQILVVVLEMVLSPFGLSALPSVEATNIDTDTLSMYLYAAVAAPIAEEILFRGLVMRGLEPYGKRFAIVMSAFAFAIFHGNLVQSPYAFVVGLVLGYAAMEHNILWAMVLHMFNNLVVADLLRRLTAGLPEVAASLILVVITWTCGIAGIILLAACRDRVAAYHKKHPIRGKYVGAFLKTPGMIIMIVLLMLSAIAPLIVQIIQGL